MATYIVLGQFTDQGIRNVADTSKRADAAKALVKKVGAKVRDLFLDDRPIRCCSNSRSARRRDHDGLRIERR